jgi:predicted NUDIX family NTP pyrophosphohydrolase
MKKLSAGVLAFRRRNGDVEVFLVHPGGPFWANKDLGSWSLPKGEYTDGEDALAAAKREFAEETSVAIDGTFLPLGELKQPSGKIISAWALEHDFDPTAMKSNTFTLEWPPKSGKTEKFPEVDAGGWFSLSAALEKLTKGQADFVRRLAQKLGVNIPMPPCDNAPPSASTDPHQDRLF